MLLEGQAKVLALVVMRLAGNTNIETFYACRWRTLGVSPRQHIRTFAGAAYEDTRIQVDTLDAN